LSSRDSVQARVLYYMYSMVTLNWHYWINYMVCWI